MIDLHRALFKNPKSNHDLFILFFPFYSFKAFHILVIEKFHLLLLLLFIFPLDSTPFLLIYIKLKFFFIFCHIFILILFYQDFYNNRDIFFNIPDSLIQYIEKTSYQKKNNGHKHLFELIKRLFHTLKIIRSVYLYG